MDAALRTAGHGGVLAFHVAGQCLALPAGDIAEIMRPRALTRVPHGPASLLGLVNLRGTVLPVVSLAALLGQAAAEPSASSRVVVVDRDARVGLLVDEVAVLAQHSDGRHIDLDALLARDFGALMRRGHVQGSTARPTATAVRAERDALALIGFRLAGQNYALPLEKVLAVTSLPAEVAEVPHTDRAMLGVMAFRGGLLPLVSLRELLGLPAEGLDRRSGRIVVVRLSGGLVGLMVDGLQAILRIPQAAVDPVPPILTRGNGEAQIHAICRLDGGRRLISILSTAKLFDSATAARILAGTEEGRANMSSEPSRQADVEQFVVFRLGDEHYGLPIAAVDEVVRRPDSLARVPRAPAFVDGIMNLRGRLVPIIDQRQRFAFNGDAGARGRRIVVVTIDGLQAGFTVDAVSEILSITADALNAVPEMTANGGQAFDRVANIGRDGRMILLIDPKALLDRAERDMLAALAGNGEATPVS